MNPFVTKQLKSLLIASVGAGITYALEGLSGVDFGIATPAVVAAASVLVNVVKTYLETLKAGL